MNRLLIVIGTEGKVLLVDEKNEPMNDEAFIRGEPDYSFIEQR